MKSQSRRTFLKSTALGFATAGMSTKSYKRILGANERVKIAVAGINGRGRAHIAMAKNLKSDLEIISLIDPDSRVFNKAIKEFPEVISASTAQFADFRKALENKNLDALTIAAPDHWHVPMAITALQAGKHVYLEKPVSHNPAEGYLLAEAEKKYGKKIQIGNQQRSSPTTAALKEAINQGLLGDVYYAKTWYESNRGSIGVGKEAAVPAELNWDLWQGPAPRRAYKDNLVHYNWHWFWHWGTGEVVNNGLHELDVARWLLGVDLPTKVSSAGGRYAFNDDWEFYDTQNVSLEYGPKKMISWEGKSCNGVDVHGRPGGRGTWIYGTEGTAVVDRGGYMIYDLRKNILKSENERNARSSVDTLGMTGLDNYHMKNFVNAIKLNEALNSPVDQAIKSVLMCHLANMSQKLGRSLAIDPTGKPKDAEAMKMWAREYEKGWEIKI